MASGKQDVIAAYTERVMLCKTGHIIQIQETGLVMHTFKQVITVSRTGQCRNYQTFPYVIVYVAYMSRHMSVLG
jgi:hypothetical protein